MVVFIYRDDMNISEQDWEKQNRDKPYPRGVADIIVAKHRNGPMGEGKLRFLAKTVKFADYEVERTG